MGRTVADAALFRALEPSGVATLTARLPTVDFAAGDVVYARGDLDAHLYILVDGKVKLGRCVEDGRENILACWLRRTCSVSFRYSTRGRSRRTPPPSPRFTRQRSTGIDWRRGSTSTLRSQAGC